MTTPRARDVAATLAELHRLAVAGADVARVAVATDADARVLSRLVAGSPLPLVADIHFRPDLALAAVAAGVAGVRVNPGTWNDRGHLRRLARAAAAAGAVVRVGGNAGSPSRRAQRHPDGVEAGLVADVVDTAHRLADAGLAAIKVSLKASRPDVLVRLNRGLAAAGDWPLHLGLTEAGPYPEGEARSAAALAILLAQGLGDTIRISLAADPVLEVHAAHRLLRALGLGARGVVVIACPTCGRCRGPVIALARALRARLDAETDPRLDGRTLAVMGCAVNGPGEAAATDAGVAALGRGRWTLFRAGRVVGPVREDDVLSELLATDLPVLAPQPRP
jgi:(E)-4-hydroxy-3-methylbut-2-enyl-diphosphate synthase